MPNFDYQIGLKYLDSNVERGSQDFKFCKILQHSIGTAFNSARFTYYVKDLDDPFVINIPIPKNLQSNLDQFKSDYFSNLNVKFFYFDGKNFNSNLDDKRVFVQFSRDHLCIMLKIPFMKSNCVGKENGNFIFKEINNFLVEIRYLSSNLARYY